MINIWVARVTRRYFCRWGDGNCIIIDTNVALHQMDFLDVAVTDGVLQNMIVLQTVLEEVKHRNLSVYKRLKTMVQKGGRNVFVFANEHHADTYSNELVGESPNDRNDRCIRVAAAWFERQLQGRHAVELVTNDRENRSRALEQGLKCQTAYEWAKANLPPKYLDNISQAADDAGASGADGAADGSDSKAAFRYPPTCQPSKSKRVFAQGASSSARYTWRVTMQLKAGSCRRRIFRVVKIYSRHRKTRTRAVARKMCSCRGGCVSIGRQNWTKSWWKCSRRASGARPK